MEKIAIFDFGSQYTHLIARRIRELKTYSEIVDPNISISRLKSYNGIILSGSPFSVQDKNAPKIKKKIFELGIPILGVCYCFQLIAFMLGGTVARSCRREFGLAIFSKTRNSPLLEGINKEETVWMSHSDSVTSLPSGFEPIGETEDNPLAAVANEELKVYGLQFHPEVTHTTCGMKILGNFLKICGCKGKWKIENIVKEKIKELKKKYAHKKVVIFVSGGVDSTTTYALLKKAIGADKILPLYVDTGLMRKNETKAVKRNLQKMGCRNLCVVDASEFFLNKLKHIVDPEKKRKIIGNVFIEIQEKILKEFDLKKEEWVLAQGTIYPDTIETACTKYSNKIKTHHNRVKKILKMVKEGRVVEPLSNLYKDEVRKIAKMLNVPNNIVKRRPFPGPGLAIRILCIDQSPKISKEERKRILSKANKLCKPYNFKATLLPIFSVGVQGDERSYKKTLLLCCKDSLDFNSLERLSTLLTNTIKEINRVVVSLWPKEISSVKLIPNTFITQRRIETLRDADYEVEKIVRKHKLYSKLWQFPVVLAPIDVNCTQKESIILRPVISKEAMTANFAKLPLSIRKEFVSILKEKFSSILYDITNKPPATICWE